MAAAVAAQLGNLQEEATCSICLEYFTDPVMIDCGHNFCRSCITQSWEGRDGNFPCPQCREISGENLRPNRQLGNMVDIAKQLHLPPVMPQGENLCEKHNQALLLFCAEDQRPICLVCRESKDHRNHVASPVEEAAKEHKVKLQEWLRLLKKEEKYFVESKVKDDEQYKTMREKLRTEKSKIESQFKKLLQLLKENEQTLHRRLEEMEKKITVVENANIAKLSNQITSLKALITEIEKKCEEPAWELLKDVRSTLSRVRMRSRMSPDVWGSRKRKLLMSGMEEKVRMKTTGANLLRAAKRGKLRSLEGPLLRCDQVKGSGKLGPLSRSGKRSRCNNVKIRCPEVVKTYKVMVTLDPDTAHRRLLVSEGGRRVRWKDTARTLPDTPKRFTCDPCVLGSEGFTSGRHYWEVQLLREGYGWEVGVAAESVNRKGEITRSPEGGVWAVEGCDGRYRALTSPQTSLYPREEPLKLGVYLDYEGGRLSLYNADSMELLYSFPQAPFTETLFPIFWLWDGAKLRLV
ncbi:E3 ubiquitin-protein ligase TRIM39-like [Lissotriton helveticus]